MAGISEAVDEQEFDAAFSAGFEKPLVTPAAAPETQPEVTKVDTATVAKAPADEKPEVIPPKYRQITEDEWTGLQTAASKMLTPEKVKDIVTGTVGELEQRIVKKLQSATPQGMSVELPDDVVSELEKDFPELAGLIRKSLEKALKGRVGTNTEQPKDAKPDYEAVSKLVKEATVKAQVEALEDVHPDWKKIVGAVNKPEDVDPNNPYRKWLATQSAEYRAKIDSTNSATIIGKSIDKFLKAQAAQAPAQQQPVPKQVTARRDRIAGALQPRGDGGRPASHTPTEEDELESGFAS